MKCRLLFALAVVLLTLPVHTAAQNAEADVRKSEQARWDAMIKADAAALERLLAPDLTYMHGDGRMVDKATFIKELQTGDFKYVSITPESSRVRVFGDAAIVNGTTGMQVQNKGVPATIRIVYTVTQVRRNGLWQMAAWHATRLAK